MTVFKRLGIAIAAAALSVAACASPEGETTPATVTPGATAVEQGREIAETNCASCHAIGATGESPHATAPPFRTLSQNYPIESLSEAFAEGILVEHPDMPEFRLEPEQINALLAYIESVQEQPAQSPTTPEPTETPQ
jgi:mono/diheme cytochrome c family protein